MEEMKTMLEITTTILDIVQGEIRHIIIGDSVYETRYIGLVNEVGYAVPEEAVVQQEEKEQQEEQEEQELFDEEPQQPKLGDFIKNVGDVPIFENPLFEFRNINSRGDSIQIIQEFFPYISSTQVTKYASIYLEQVSSSPRNRTDLGYIVFNANNCHIYSIPLERMKKGETPERVIREYYPHIQYKSVIAYAREYKKYIQGKLNKKETSKKRRKHTSGEIIGKSKKYHRNILKDEYEKVKLSLNKFNFLTTTNNISKETNLSINIVRAILDYMITQNEVKKKQDKNNVILYEVL